jgi:hypothetical protein
VGIGVDGAKALLKGSGVQTFPGGATVQTKELGGGWVQVSGQFPMPKGTGA